MYAHKHTVEVTGQSPWTDTVANSRIKIVIAQGGNAKSGTFHIVMA